ncbi:MAG: hypothetical protein AAFN74_24105 [Myxococcota bacterium]
MLLIMFSGCAGGSDGRAPDATPSSPTDGASAGQTADVTRVEVSEASGSWRFSVQISSPDTGCTQYADWWEVVTEDGALAYRRILAHSHVDEQPFTRSGGPVMVDGDAIVWVRAHMNTGGYGVTMRGTPTSRFEVATPPEGFAAALETTPPLPANCAF